MCKTFWHGKFILLRTFITVLWFSISEIFIYLVEDLVNLVTLNLFRVLNLEGASGSLCPEWSNVFIRNLGLIF